MDNVEKAFNSFDRKDFVTESMKSRASADMPLPIGYGQTISQPSTVRLMLKWLDAHTGDKILDVGSGSGWTTALLSKIIGAKGKVFAVEIIPELVKFGRDNCFSAGVMNADFFESSKRYGLPDKAPFDRILVSAAAKSLPHELIGQLKVGGKLVIPVKNNILEITKTSDNSHDIITHPGFIFVPLINPKKS